MKKFYLMIFAVVTLAGMLAISGCKKKETYTVTFNPNGGTGTMEAQTFTEGEAQALTRNAFTYDGYTFTGWNTVQGGSGASYPDGYTLTATADMTLYAQWSANTVTVTFDANGGTGEMAPQTFTIGTAQALAGNMFSYDIFHFQNWNTAADGTGTSYGDQQVVNPSSNITLYAQWDGGIQNGHKFIDLGLPSGTKWALTNVGSTTPEGSGNYYAWGETEPKDTYNSSTYNYSDSPETLPSSRDAASANWGGSWRMPTITEMQELIDNCTWQWTTLNGVNGRLFTGPNGNSIFLPAAGGRFGAETDDVGSYGYYWSSSVYDSSDAWNLYFGSGFHGMGSSYRDGGLSVRAVCQSQN